MCVTPVLNAHQLALAYRAAVDAFADYVSVNCVAHDDTLGRLEGGDPDLYEGAYDSAMLTIEGGADLHEATTQADDSIRAALTPAGIA